MAAKYVTRLSNFSRAFPQMPSLSNPGKVSRFIYTSTSNNQQGAKPVGDKRKEEYSGYNTDEAIGEAGNRSAEMAGKAAERSQKAKDKAGEVAHDAKETTTDMGGKMADYAHETKESTKDAAGEMMDMTKEGTNMAAEGAQSLAEKTKQTMEDAWSVAKDTTQKMKESVVGKSDEDKDFEYFVEDHVSKPAGTTRKDQEKVMNEDLVNKRKTPIEHDDDKKF